ncbi:MAG: cellulose synthase operon protein YhjQ/BcsQ [Candidatus Korobacteraceae bacterium]
MRPDTPDDVANLCNVAELDKARYKVFTRTRHEQIAVETDSEPAASERDLVKLIEEPQAGRALMPRHAPEPPSHSWTMLHAVAEANSVTYAEDSQVVSEEIHVPTLSVFSTAGGVGKTFIVAALARAQSRSGQRVLVVHGEEQYTLTPHFGGQAGKPGRLRTFFPPTRKEGQINVLAHDFDGFSQGGEIDGWLQREVASVEDEVDRVLVEVSRLSSEDRHFLGLSHATLAVLVPDIGSLLSVPKLKNLLEQQYQSGFRKVNPYFVLNKFDANSAFHNEIRKHLRQQLGPRLLPFTVRRSDLVAEAIAAGMTVLDYAPRAAIVDDLLRLSAWVNELGSIREVPISKSATRPNSAIASV